MHCVQCIFLMTATDPLRSATQYFHGASPQRKESVSSTRFKMSNLDFFVGYFDRFNQIKFFGATRCRGSVLIHDASRDGVSVSGLMSVLPTRRWLVAGKNCGPGSKASAVDV